MSGRNFVRNEFCQKGILSGTNFVRQNFVRQEFCQEGILSGSRLCQEGILSGKVFVRKRALPGRNFVRKRALPRRNFVRKGFCQEICQEGILSGSGPGRNFVRRVFVRKRALPGRNFVRKGFCQEAGSAWKEFCQERFLSGGLCQEGILSGRDFVRKRALPGKNFVRKGFWKGFCQEAGSARKGESALELGGGVVVGFFFRGDGGQSASGAVKGG